MYFGRNKLYIFIFATCVMGYVWLFYNIQAPNHINSFQVCLIKSLTNIPCPSCGSTRAICSIFQGEILNSIYINPMGLIIALIMILAPFWIFYDAIFNKLSLFNCYKKMETYLKNPKISIPLVLLVIINWIWNITKVL